MNRRSSTYSLHLFLAGCVTFEGSVSTALGDVSAPLKQIMACRDVKVDAARLACFDRESAALKAAETDAATTPAPRLLTRLDPQEAFGLSHDAVLEKEVSAGVRTAEAPHIKARISALSQTGNGVTIFTLDNGQIWQEMTADLAEGDLLAKVGQEVTLSHGALGSYSLRLHSGRGCKVTRVR